MRLTPEVKETLQEVRQLLDFHREQETLFVVEGKRDVAALHKLGILRIVSLTKPLFSIVEEIAVTEKNVILLVDLDKEGKRLYAKLSRDLRDRGVKVDDELRELLFKLPIRHIEGLDTFLQNRE